MTSASDIRQCPHCLVVVGDGMHYCIDTARVVQERLIRKAQADALREAAAILDEDPEVNWLPYHKLGDGGAIADWLRSRAAEVEKGEA